MKRALVVIAIVFAALGTLAVRVVIEGRRALAEGDAALAAKKPLEAIQAWESAARWYFPLAPHVDEAYARLVEIANADAKHRTVAWRAVRRAATATRSVWQPHQGDLDAANAALAKLSAEHPEGATAAGANVAERTAYHTTQLARDRRPSTGAAALAVLGILSWLAGIGVVIGRGIDPSGRLVRKPALVGIGLSLVGVLGWAVGLYNA
ncbi:MAG: hypothetical protein M4D80_01525 [Myxococcota bacterium]|nr:hypothetical protein [Myxococcota bacterium]